MLHVLLHPLIALWHALFAALRGLTARLARTTPTTAPAATPRTALLARRTAPTSSATPRRSARPLWAAGGFATALLLLGVAAFFSIAGGTPPAAHAAGTYSLDGTWDSVPSNYNNQSTRGVVISGGLGKYATYYVDPACSDGDAVLRGLPGTFTPSVSFAAEAVSGFSYASNGTSYTCTPIWGRVSVVVSSGPGDPRSYDYMSVSFIDITGGFSLRRDIQGTTPTPSGGSDPTPTPAPAPTYTLTPQVIGNAIVGKPVTVRFCAATSDNSSTAGLTVSYTINYTNTPSDTLAFANATLGSDGCADVKVTSTHADPITAVANLANDNTVTTGVGFDSYYSCFGQDDNKDTLFTQVFWEATLKDNPDIQNNLSASVFDNIRLNACGFLSNLAERPDVQGDSVVDNFDQVSDDVAGPGAQVRYCGTVSKTSRRSLGGQGDGVLVEGTGFTIPLIDITTKQYYCANLVTNKLSGNGPTDAPPAGQVELRPIAGLVLDPEYDQLQSTLKEDSTIQTVSFNLKYHIVIKFVSPTWNVTGDSTDFTVSEIKTCVAAQNGSDTVTVPNWDGQGHNLTCNKVKKVSP